MDEIEVWNLVCNNYLFSSLCVYLQFGGPIPLSKLDGEANSINTTKPEKVIGNLLPKRHNNPHRRPPSPTNANIFVDKPDFFVIPEPQRKKRPKPNPRSSPELKLPAPSPPGAHSEESPSPPLPPKHAERIPLCSSAPYSPKLDNVEKARQTLKLVRFDSSVPPEEEPPVLPRRGIPVSRPETKARCVPMHTSAVVHGSESDCEESDVTISTDVVSSSHEDLHTGPSSGDEAHSPPQISFVRSSADCKSPSTESSC